MERCFLSFLDYRLFISGAEFDHYEQGMRLHFAALDRASSAVGSSSQRPRTDAAGPKLKIDHVANLPE